MEDLLSIISFFTAKGNFLISGFSDSKPLERKGWPPRLIISNRDVKIWDMHSGKLVKSMSGNHHNIYSVSFSPDGSKISYIEQHNTFDKDGIITLVSFLAPKKLQTLSLKGALLLRYFVMGEEKNQPVAIPKGYKEAFLALPKKIREYFYNRNIELIGSAAGFPLPYKPIKTVSYKSFKRKTQRTRRRRSKKEKRKTPF